eukprot:14702640-Alexandrium_andersonii.AAC.1
MSLREAQAQHAAMLRMRQHEARFNIRSRLRRGLSALQVLPLALEGALRRAAPDLVTLPAPPLKRTLSCAQAPPADAGPPGAAGGP